MSKVDNSLRTLPDLIEDRTIPFMINHGDKEGIEGKHSLLTVNRLVAKAQVLASSPEFLGHCVCLVSNFISRSKVSRPTGMTWEVKRRWRGDL